MVEPINIFAVTVTYNPELNLLRRQILSLINQVTGIIIVDNGSDNIKELKGLISQMDLSREGNFCLIDNERNMGLGRAQNQGIERAISLKARDVILLDQDSVLEDDFLTNMLMDRRQLVDEGKNVGAIGPVYFSEVTNEVYPITKFRGPFIERIEPSDSPVEASFLIASGCLISVDVLQTVGLMNEELFIDCIDVDWSFRAYARGFKLFASPRARMMHTIGDNRMSVFGRSISVHSPLRRYYLFRNSIYMVKSPNIPFGYKIREIVFNGFRLMIFLVVSKNKTKYLKYSLSGFRDGILGRWGECKHRY